ncbi:MAG TPA: penicillin acylase family protein, partial [candidate division Zixibacteria bacterium]|nr:penicillin acylase family protein [candidate division Zixibacteria bacterium]
MTPRTRRMLGGAALVFAGLAVGFAIAVWATLDGTLPPCDGEIRLAGLDGPIEITFDSMGVAQVWAETAHDGLFGLGWLHAADRLFQADFTRRVAQGWLSELLGAATAAFDSERRRDGHARLARA